MIDCSQAICPNDCSGHGECYNKTSTPVCNCDVGWTGSQCNNQDSSVMGTGTEDSSSNWYYWAAIGACVGVALLTVATIIVIKIRKDQARKKYSQNTQLSPVVTNPV